MTTARARVEADLALTRVALRDVADKPIQSLSGGMAQRLMIARAVMHRPAVLFLDEPTAGLDPQSRLSLHDLVGELQDAGQTVVLVTHDMDEADRLSDRGAIIDVRVHEPAILRQSRPGHPAQPGLPRRSVLATYAINPKTASSTPLCSTRRKRPRRAWRKLRPALHRQTPRVPANRAHQLRALPAQLRRRRRPRQRPPLPLLHLLDPTALRHRRLRRRTHPRRRPRSSHFRRRLAVYADPDLIERAIAEIHHGTEQRRKAAHAFVQRLVVVQRDTIKPSFYVRGGLPPDRLANAAKPPPTGKGFALWHLR